jgi:hypothetical protein
MQPTYCTDGVGSGGMEINSQPILKDEAALSVLRRVSCAGRGCAEDAIKCRRVVVSTVR